MKKIIIINICILFCLCGCESKQKDFNNRNEKQIENEIILNLKEIEKVTDLTSSNPYDYTKNEYYNDIVKLGSNAVPVLEKMYKNNKLTGLNAYISALAIQDITKCYLHEEYNLDWSTAEEFYDLWKNYNCSFKK